MLTVPITRSNARMPEMQQQHRYEDVRQPANRLQGMQVQTNADMFGAAAGRDLEHAGYMTQRSANQFAHVVDDYNTTKARDAARQMQQGFLEWQSEAQKKQGEAGMNTAADYDAWAQSRRQELTKDMSDVQRGRFEAIAGTHMAAQKHWAVGYGEQQEQTYKKAAWQAEISAGGDMLVANIHNPGLAEQAIEQIKDAAFTMGQNGGIGEKATMELMRKSVAGALIPAIHARIQAGDTGTADALMKRYGGQIGGVGMAQLGAALEQKRKSQAAEAKEAAAESIANGLYSSVEGGEMSGSDALLKIRNIQDPKLQAHARSSYMQRLHIADMARKESIGRGHAAAADDFDRTNGNLQAQYDLMRSANKAALSPGATEEQKAYARSVEERYKSSVQYAEDGIRSGSNPAAYEAVSDLVYGGAGIDDLKKTGQWAQLSPTARKTFEKAVKDGQQVSLSELTRLYNDAFREREGKEYSAKSGKGDREIFLQQSLETIRDTKRGNEPGYPQKLVDIHFMKTTKPGGKIWDTGGTYGRQARTERGALPVMSESERTEVEKVFTENPQVRNAWLDYAKKNFGEGSLNYAMRAFILQSRLKEIGRRGDR